MTSGEGLISWLIGTSHSSRNTNAESCSTYRQKRQGVQYKNISKEIVVFHCRQRVNQQYNSLWVEILLAIKWFTHLLRCCKVCDIKISNNTGLQLRFFYMSLCNSEYFICSLSTQFINVCYSSSCVRVRSVITSP